MPPGHFRGPIPMWSGPFFETGDLRNGPIGPANVLSKRRHSIPASDAYFLHLNHTDCQTLFAKKHQPQGVVCCQRPNRPNRPNTAGNGLNQWLFWLLRLFGRDGGEQAVHSFGCLPFVGVGDAVVELHGDGHV